MRIILLLALFFPHAEAQRDCSVDSILQKVLISNQDQVPIEFISVPIQRMGEKLIEEAQAGKKFSYWVDREGQMLFSEPRAFDHNQSVTVLKDSLSKDGFMIKEAGNFSFDKKAKRYLFEQKKSLDLTPNEIDQAIRKQTNIEFTRVADPRFDQATVLKCAEVLGAQQRAENFLKDSVVSSAIVTLSSFLTIETISPSKKTKAEKATMVSSDLLANTLSSAASSYIIKPLILKNTGIISDFAQRTATDFATNSMIKKPIYDAINKKPKEQSSEEKKSLGEKLIPYDTSFSVIRFLPKRAIERATVYTLPKLMVEACLSNPTLNFAVGPRSVRILDRYMWGLAYMGGRKVYLNQLDEEKKK